MALAATATVETMAVLPTNKWTPRCPTQRLGRRDEPAPAIKFSGILDGIEAVRSGNKAEEKITTPISISAGGQ
jgi:hypothetical protein